MPSAGRAQYAPGASAASATGSAATAIGGGVTLSPATASGAGSVVIGAGATDNGNASSTVLGDGASVGLAVGGWNVALGNGSIVTRGGQTYQGAFLSGIQTSVGTVSVGTLTGLRQITGVAAGSAATDAVNIGQLAAVNNALITAGLCVNVGLLGSAPTCNSTTSGAGVKYVRTNSTGPDAVAGGVDSLAIGPGATTNAAGAVAIGSGATAAVAGGVALGANAVAGANVNGQGTIAGAGAPVTLTYNNAANATVGAVSVGSGPTDLRQIKNLADGTAATDAVTVGQVTSVVTQTDAALVALQNADRAAVRYATDGTGAPLAQIDLTRGGTIGTGPVGVTGVANATTATGAVALAQLPLLYSSTLGVATPATPSNSATLVGAGGVTLMNLAPGLVGATSTQGVNGAQLWGTASSTAALLGTTVNANGTLAAASYTVGTSAYGSLNGAISALNDVAVRYRTTAAGAPLPIVDLSRGGSMPATLLTGLTKGSVLAGSSDAVTGDQLASTNAALAGTTASANAAASGLVTANANLAVLQGAAAQVAGSLGGGAAFDPATGAFTAPSYAVQGATYGNVGAALGALDAGTTANTAGIAALQADVAGGALGLVRQDATSRLLTIGAGTDGGALSVAGLTGLRKLTGLANGTDGTDAVTFGQLTSALASVSASGSPLVAGASATTGTLPQATGQDALGIGYGAVASARNAVALGANSVADRDDVVSVGSVGAERRLVNVSAGAVSATSTDAVNGAQLYAVLQMAGGSASVAPQLASVQTSLTNLQTGVEGPFRASADAGTALPSVAAANAVAGGYGAVSSAAYATAVGTGSEASAEGATAIGAGAQATGDPTTAVGYHAVASGDEASAFGAYSQASALNSTALGRSALASGAGAVSVGVQASATGGAAIAIGNAATAAQDNAIAIGAGVSTTRANQVAIGGAQSTYTLAGVASGQSAAKQSGATAYVTTDANGNLATSAYGPATTADLDGRVDRLEAQALQLQQGLKRAYGGTAIAVALSGGALPEGKTFALAMNYGTFHGQSGLGGNAFYRASDNIYVNGGVGFSSAGDVAGRGGFTLAW